MSDGFVVKYSHVKDATDQMRTETNNVKDALDNLETRMKEVRSALEGETATSYDEAMARWRAHVSDMNFLLGKAENALNDVANNYNTTDLREGALWAALR